MEAQLQHGAVQRGQPAHEVEQTGGQGLCLKPFEFSDPQQKRSSDSAEDRPERCSPLVAPGGLKREDKYSVA